MLNFNFHNPTNIIFGKDSIASIGKVIPSDAKVMITYGGGSIKEFGVLEKILGLLKNKKIVEFGGIEPNPKYETLVKAVEMIKEEGIDFLLAVGGGSVMDGTKFIALAAKYPTKNYHEIITSGFGPSKVKEALSFGTVVTLPATGSEMNSGSVITYKGRKIAFGSPLTFPKFSILDPILTYTLPEKQVANGVVDAFVHVMEQYLTFPSEARFQDRTSEGILISLMEIGRKTIDNPEDYDARANLMWCATMALNGLIGAGVPHDWATHMIGHELTASFGIDHAQSLAIILPSMMMHRKEQKREKILQYASRVLGIDKGSENEIIDQAIARTRDFFESLGVPTKLSEYGVEASELSVVTSNLKLMGLTALSEKGDLGLDKVSEILESSF